MKNYYEILEVSENASTEVIDRAYKVLAKKYHPDTWPSDKAYWAESKFKELSEAYQVLSNPSLRMKYDMKIGLKNNSSNNNYDYLNFEEETLNNTSYNQPNDVNRFVKPNIAYFKRYANHIQTLLKNEKLKSSEERSKDFKALVLTIIIVAIILFVFWKVPFLKNFLFL